MTLTKAGLRRVGAAALAGLSEAEIRADPAGAMKVAMDAMRATFNAREALRADQARRASG